MQIFGGGGEIVLEAKFGFYLGAIRLRGRQGDLKLKSCGVQSEPAGAKALVVEDKNTSQNLIIEEES